MTFAAIVEAAQFAAEKHKNQRRSDVDASPFINHRLALVSIIAGEGSVEYPGQNCPDRAPMRNENHIDSVWSKWTNARCLATVHGRRELRKQSAA